MSGLQSSPSRRCEPAAATSCGTRHAAHAPLARQPPRVCSDAYAVATRGVRIASPDASLESGSLERERIFLPSVAADAVRTVDPFTTLPCRV
eukprot:1911663-Pleurochrysis_carterae.AAC.2